MILEGKFPNMRIRFSKDEEGTKFLYSEDDIHHLVDSVFKNILNSESQELVEPSITSSSDVLIDKIAGFIIKHVCSTTSSAICGWKVITFFIIHIFGRWEKAVVSCQCLFLWNFGGCDFWSFKQNIPQRVRHCTNKSVRDSEDELCDKAEKLIHFITGILKS